MDKFWGRTVALAVCLFAAGTQAAPPPASLTWDDLVPPAVMSLEKEATALQEAFMALKPEERQNFQAVAHELSVKKRLQSGTATDGDLSEADLQVLQDEPSVKYPKALAFWKSARSIDERMRAQDDAVDPAMNGRTVRIPGYILPLELDGTKVREFLLVPYVGACIHTPPPPANQMVYVKVSDVSDGFENDGLYTPVWVEGTLLSSGGKYDVSFIDGNRAVAAGYTLDATKVELYKE